MVNKHFIFCLLFISAFLILNAQVKKERIYEQIAENDLKWVIKVYSNALKESDCPYNYLEPQYRWENPLIPLCSESDSITITFYEGQNQIPLLEDTTVYIYFEYPVDNPIDREKIIAQGKIKNGIFSFLGKDLIVKDYPKGLLKERKVRIGNHFENDNAIPQKYRKLMRRNEDGYIIFLNHQAPCN